MLPNRPPHSGLETNSPSLHQTQGDSGRPVGFVVLKMDAHGIADIDLLAVDPDAQGRGIATMLHQFAYDRSEEASMAYVVVATADDPRHAPARRAYERAHFTSMPIQWNLQIIRL